MAISYGQGTATTSCDLFTGGGFCTGRTVSGAWINVLCNGALSGTTNFGCAASDTNRANYMMEIAPSASTSWDAGTWTVRLNVTTANMNLTITEIYICRVSSGCANQATIGSATGLSISLGSTGVKSQTVTGASQSPGAGDLVEVIFVTTNGAMSSQNAVVTLDQNIDSPFTVSGGGGTAVKDLIQEGMIPFAR